MPRNVAQLRDIYHGLLIVWLVGSATSAGAQSRIEPIFPAPAVAPGGAPDAGVSDGASLPPLDPTTLPMPVAPESARSKIQEGEAKSLLSPEVPQGLAKAGDLNLLGQPILKIRIVDNTKTDSNTVEYIAAVKRGAQLSAALVERVRVNLEASGLFKQVAIYWEPMNQDEVAGVRLVISAKDKLSWIIAPTFAFSPPNYGGGLAYAESNLLGRNLKFLVYGTYTTADKMFLVYFLDPHIGTTPLYWRFDAIVRRDRIYEYASGNLGHPRLERATDVDTFGLGVVFGLSIKRRLNVDARLKIYYDRINRPTCYNTQTPNGFGTPDVNAEQGGACLRPARSGLENAIAVQASYEGRSTVAGIVAGPLVRAEWVYGPRWLGNVTGDYHLLNLRFMWGLRFWKEHNLLLKSWASVYFNPPFKQEVEAGGAELRGYIFRQFRGDTSFRATVEYIVPVFTVQGFSLRAIAFFDTNLTWFRSLPQQVPGQPRVDLRGNSFRNFLPDTPSGIGRESWNNGLGGGIRLYLKGVILPLIGIDLAYGIESRAFQYYITLGSTID